MFFLYIVVQICSENVECLVLHDGSLLRDLKPVGSSCLSVALINSSLHISGSLRRSSIKSMVWFRDHMDHCRLHLAHRNIVFYFQNEISPVMTWQVLTCSLYLSSVQRFRLLFYKTSLNSHAFIEADFITYSVVCTDIIMKMYLIKVGVSFKLDFYTIVLCNQCFC